MRWDDLFDDLEAQWDAESAAVLQGEIAEMTRLETSMQLLSERFRAHIGHDLGIWLDHGYMTSLRITAVGKDWFSASEGMAGVLVPLGAVRAIEGMSPVARQELGPSRKRLGIGWPLRVLSRNRVRLSVLDCRGERLAQGMLAGVGKDHIDVTGLPGPDRSSLDQSGSGGPAGGVDRRRRTVPFHAVGMFRSDTGLAL